MLLNYLLIVGAVLFVSNLIVGLNSSYDAFANMLWTTLICLCIASIVGTTVTDESRTKILEPIDVVQTNDVTFVWLDGYPLQSSTETSEWNRNPKDTIVVVKYTIVPIVRTFEFVDRDE